MVNGMRATTGAIEEVWINTHTFEPTYRVIGGGKPTRHLRIGLISLLSEMFMTGLVDKAGNVNLATGSPRLREGAHGGEYVVACGHETENGPGHRPHADRYRQSAARQGRHLRRLHGSGGGRGHPAGERRQGAGRRLVRQVHQRRKGGPDRPAARHGMVALSSSWATRPCAAPTRPCWTGAAASASRRSRSA